MDNIYYDKTKLIAGINKVADAVKVTLGSAGTNAILQEDLPPFHIVTNDGISIANKIKLSDPVENIGANIMKEVAQRANRESGDGTTTTMVLTQAILEASEDVFQGNAMEIKRSLDECLPIIHKAIDDQTKEIDVDHVSDIATISAEDETIGALLQDIYKEIGKEGIVELDNSNTSDTYYTVTEGVRLRNCGYMYPYMTNDDKHTKATHLVPKILITKQKISTLQEIDHLFGTLSKLGVTELVIFCNEIDPIVSTTLAQTQMQGLFKTLVIKAPTLWKDWLYDDFAKITGATIVDVESGLKLKNVRIEHLGTCDKLITTKDETVVIGIHDITKHLEALKEQKTEEAELRLAWLQTKTAILKLGANSESELSYKRLKVEDARNASYLALKGGVVAGGGIALLNAAKALRSNKETQALKVDIDSKEVTKPNLIGVQILYKALLAPFKQICKNAGVDVQKIMDDDSWNLKDPTKGSIDINMLPESRGFNSKSLKIVDMWEEGIIDPAIIVKNCIKNAISVAGTVLTANVVVTNTNETKG